MNTIAHAGVFSPPFPLPDALKIAQLKVTDPQVAVAATVCAAALAAKIASIAIASGRVCRQRRTIARRIPTLVAAGVSLSLVMLSLLSIGRVLDLRRRGGKKSARGDERRGVVPQRGRQLRRAPGRVPDASVWCSRTLGPRALPTGCVTAGPSSPARVWGKVQPPMYHDQPWAVKRRRRMYGAKKAGSDPAPNGEEMSPPGRAWRAGERAVDLRAGRSTARHPSLGSEAKWRRGDRRPGDGAAGRIRGGLAQTTFRAR